MKEQTPMSTQISDSIRFIDELSEEELLEAVTAAMDDEGYAVSWRIAKRLRERGFDISPQGLGGALRRHPGLRYGFDYPTGLGRHAWELRS